MHVIETRYNGYRFRSRLEARWAVFFDQCGIVYRYEPEAYDLTVARCLLGPEQHDDEAECCCRLLGSIPETCGYLPDFFVENVGLRTMDRQGVFFEVKGIYDEEANTKATLLGHLTNTPVIIATIPPPMNNEEGIFQLFPWWDNWMGFMRCVTCQRMKIEFYESNYMVCSHCNADATMDHPRLLHAAMVARSWRFEPRKER